MGKISKLIAGNLAVLIGLVLVLNLVAATYLDIEDWVNDRFPSRDK